MSGEIQKSITDLSTDMVKSLFEGDFSFADKGIKALKGLGESVLTQFVTPATTAISDFISGAIKNLLSGEGLGGVMKSLTDIGKTVGDMFGVTGGAAEAAGGVAGAAGSGAGAAGSAGSTAGSGLAGIVGAVGSVVSAVSGIIGNFQMAKQETSLNAIA